MSEYEEDSISSEASSDYASDQDIPNQKTLQTCNHEESTSKDCEHRPNGLGTVQCVKGLTVADDLLGTELKSKRQRRLTKIPNPGSNGKSKGDVVGESNGSMIWWNEDGDAGDGTMGVWGKLGASPYHS